MDTVEQKTSGEEALPSMVSTSSAQPIASSSSLSDPPATDTAEPTLQTSPEKEESSAGQEDVTSGTAAHNLAASGVLPTNAATTGISTERSVNDRPVNDQTINGPVPAPNVTEDTIAVHQLDGRPSNMMKMEANPSSTTPAPATRGSTRGRPRGSRARGGGRGGKRKREERDDGDSDSSEEVSTPMATMTKSGRSIQKPTSFVPPPTASPITASHHKRKRPYSRNPESAVCRVCQRGTSPASNMIVFCDGCNTPYHRYCHHPPIDQSVIDEVDKEWYCKPCEEERVVPVPEAEIADFVSAEGASIEQRQKYFASLPPGMLVTLLTKATTLQPDLPLFDPDFRARQASNNATIAAKPFANGHGHPPTAANAPPAEGTAAVAGAANVSKHSQELSIARREHKVPEDHPSTYPRPGHGLMSSLPPEQQDLQWLVDDDDHGAFSHLYQVDAGAADESVNGGSFAER